MKTSFRFALCLVLLLLPCAAALAEGDTLTNDDVIKMSKAGLGNDVIIAKIDQAQTVDFKLDTDDLIALKEAGVHQDVVSAMLKRTTAPAAAEGAGGDEYPEVNLVAASGTTRLTSMRGAHRQFAAPFVGLRHFLEFDGPAAEIRIKDRQPAVQVAVKSNPSAHWWFVRLDPDDDDPTRGLDLQSAGAWGGAHDFEADEDSVIKSEITEVKPGLWQFKPKKPLKPGEYGLYTEDGYVYDFGVDK